MSHFTLANCNPRVRMEVLVVKHMYVTIPKLQWLSLSKTCVSKSLAGCPCFIYYIRCLNVTTIFFLANCNSGCQNGGVCSRPNRCNCPAGYSGDRCQTGRSYICCRKLLSLQIHQPWLYPLCGSFNVVFLFELVKCTPSCQNGGVCSRPNVCDCPTGYSGNRCQTSMLPKIILYQILYIYILASFCVPYH